MRVSRHYSSPPIPRIVHTIKVFLFYALANLGDGWYTGVNVLAAALGADCLSIQ